MRAGGVAAKFSCRGYFYHAAGLRRAHRRGTDRPADGGYRSTTFVDPGSHLNMPGWRALSICWRCCFSCRLTAIWLISMLVGHLPRCRLKTRLTVMRSRRSPAPQGWCSQRIDAGTPDHHPCSDREPGVGFTQPWPRNLSVFVIGFPLTADVGILLMSLLMPLIAPFCEHLFMEYSTLA